eukprot:TRINITY_DN3508_c0_g2_i1.p1 TRINITY_DN3508_c0_g2~~TRINITY_DN3508_c0_g2_i1.p1  ORF type:complete len:878 (-),score=111.23 TRINITY_DN3508_c0_g2_i1:51-2684(-)
MFHWFHGYDSEEFMSSYDGSDSSDSSDERDFYLYPPRQKSPEINDEDISDWTPALVNLETNITGKKRDLDTLREERAQLELQLAQLRDRISDTSADILNLETDRKRLRLDLRRPEKKQRDEVAARMHELFASYFSESRAQSTGLEVLLGSIRSLIDEHLGKPIIPGSPWHREDLLMLKVITTEAVTTHLEERNPGFQKLIDELSGHWVSAMLWYQFSGEMERQEWVLALRAFGIIFSQAAVDATSRSWDDSKLVSIMNSGSCSGKYTEAAGVTLKRLEFLRKQGDLQKCINLARYCGLVDQEIIDRMHTGHIEEAVADCVANEDITGPQMIKIAEALDVAYARSQNKTSSLGFLKFQVLVSAFKRTHASISTALARMLSLDHGMVEIGMSLFKMLPRAPSSSSSAVPPLTLLSVETVALHFTDGMTFDMMLADAVAMLRHLPVPLQDFAVTPIAVQLMIKAFPDCCPLLTKAAEYFSEIGNPRDACYLMLPAISPGSFNFVFGRRCLKYSFDSKSASLQHEVTTKILAIIENHECRAILQLAEAALDDYQMPKASLAIARCAMAVAQKELDRYPYRDLVSDVRRFFLQKLIKHCSTSEAQEIVSSYMVEQKDCAAAAQCASELLTAGLSTEALRASIKGITLPGKCNRWSLYSKYVDLAMEHGEPDTAVQLCTEICTREPVQPALDKLRDLSDAAQWPARKQAVLQALRGRSFCVGGYHTRPVIDLFWAESVPEYSQDIMQSSDDAAYLLEKCVRPTEPKAESQLQLLDLMFDKIVNSLLLDESAITLRAEYKLPIDRAHDVLMEVRPDLAVRLFEQRAMRRMEVITPTAYTSTKEWFDRMQVAYSQRGMKAQWESFFKALHKRYKGKKALWRQWGL